MEEKKFYELLFAPRANVINAKYTQIEQVRIILSVHDASYMYNRF